ncbi:MAG: TIR domain-containing protein [Acidimicrobiales bacterium]|nr:TIR domain-containing protein [Acidimicrobiales bacterium]MYD34504.1 TIR domain-containing protein [Acidimicrobiales bacterium]MYI09546.1 TIR domain-containing protein [Acidimicrobiales bacterium]
MLFDLREMATRRTILGNDRESDHDVFISYAWEDDEHREWIRGLATQLRHDGVRVLLDQWETVPGDQLPEFMAQAISQSKYVVIICTPRYKQRSEAGLGGVAYEGDIMTAEVLLNRDHRKFIPVLRRGSWEEAAPTWLKGKLYIDLSGNPYSADSYSDLLNTLLDAREQAPDVAPRASSEARMSPSIREHPMLPSFDSFRDIEIRRLMVDEVTEPSLDGTAGSALYRVPFELSRTPPRNWADLCIRNWDHPPTFATRHRPGTMSIDGARLWLNRTTIEEVRDVHRETLVAVIDVTNAMFKQHLEELSDRLREVAETSRVHRANVRDVAGDIEF